jgi:hypothetical protein
MIKAAAIKYQYAMAAVRYLPGKLTKRQKDI